MSANKKDFRIDWPCEMVVSSRRKEEAMRPVLHRRGEWGRGRDLPEERLKEIEQAGKRNGMSLYQALSLHRGLLRSFNSKRFQSSSAMGSNKGQQHVAALFEQALVDHLKSVLGKKSGVFLTER